MDVSAQTLREVEFREKLRGYHPDDVDEFLERVAAGVEFLQDRLRQAIERAQRAESRAAETHDGDDALKRTLVLAQRTAEMAVQEARQEADRIAASARAEANAIVAQAEDMARRTIEETQGGIRAELTQLESARDHLRGDISALERHLDQERLRLRASLAEALDAVETTLAPAPPAPETADVVIPPRRNPKVTLPPLDEPATATSPTNGYLGEPEHFDIDLDAMDRERLAADAVVEVHEPEPETEPEPEPEYAPTALEPSPSVENGRTGLVADGPFDDLADDSIAAAPPTYGQEPPPAEPVWAAPVEVAEATPELEPDLEYEAAASPDGLFNEQDADDEAGEDEDPFIAELRRAITDTQPLGPREEGDVNPDSQDDPLVHGDVLDSSRLGSLLRRRR
ncbi:MAG: cell division initiation protein [Actinomycetota bacterium]|jgi:cell division initiation protein